MNILIAEDDAVSRRILEETLTNWDYAVTVTKDGLEAWEALQRDDSPMLAILDNMMPGMDGFELCRKVREMPRDQTPYILLLTAMSSKDDVVRGIEAGANDYLTKPFHREELRVRVGAGIQILNLQTSLFQRVQELEGALTKVKQLQGILPMCSYCRQVRDDKDYWQKVEGYIEDNSGIQFSHGICPDCYLTVEAELNERKERQAAK